MYVATCVCFNNHELGEIHKMATPQEPDGVINPEELYTLEAFKRRLGVRDATLRTARRAGLRVYYVHKHAYIYGRDWIDYVLKSQNGSNSESVRDAG
jgi:hypothetical protein